jgi:hypothetical protein
MAVGQGKVLIILSKDVTEQLKQLSKRTSLSEEDLLLLLMIKADWRLSKEQGFNPLKP